MAEFNSPSFRSFPQARTDSVHSSHQHGRVEQNCLLAQESRANKMSKAGSYFDVRHDAKMKSPTAALVADLSQNFHLGASPAVPTPRRSLMAQFSLREEDAMQWNLQEPVTPYDDDVHSSPGEIMDTSPLPLVGRRTLVRSISMFEPESNAQSTNARSLQRPKLQSRQAFSSFCMPKVPERSIYRPPFAFGKENNDLADQFEESPKKLSGHFLGAHKIDAALCESRSAASPAPRPALLPITVNTMQRRLPQFRRTQSMVAKNDEFLEPELALQQTPRSMPSARLDITSPATPEHYAQECQILPSFESRADQMRRINGVTLARVLEGAFKHMYDRLVIIDCRFPHEFSGGHIPNAINISSLEAMDNHALLSAPVDARTLIVLHCEYSAHRAPRIALHLRNRDRMMNAHRYPALFYPEMYILDGGYSLFFREHRHLVGSMGYVEMNDPSHKPFASKQMHDFRKHTRFQRTQSYTFGQHSNASIGGTSMQREDNFKLQPPTSELAAPPFLATAGSLGRSKSALPLDNKQDTDIFPEDDSFNDSSMMDVDDPNMTSPLPSYSNVPGHTLQTGRVALGRTLSSF